MSESRIDRLLLAVALDPVGAHPAGWRLSSTEADQMFTADPYVTLARTAERGGLDLVTIEDFLALGGAADEVRGRLDAVAVAARIAPSTERIGIVPTVTTTHTEPFHVAKAIATLDHVSLGRAGWEVTVSATMEENAHLGRRELPRTTTLYAEADDAVEAVIRLWDSWEDDAEIRDETTGRFIDRTKLHHIDFEGPHFSVKGPSITPRSPQGQHPLVIRADRPEAIGFAASRADLIRVRVRDLASARNYREEVRDAVGYAGRDPNGVPVLADLAVLLAPDEAEATRTRDQLDRVAGRGLPGALPSYTGDPAGLARLLRTWWEAGAADGFVVHPAVAPDDLQLFVDAVVPLLRVEGLVRQHDSESMLRTRLGLPRPASRYASPTTDRRTTESIAGGIR